MRTSIIVQVDVDQDDAALLAGEIVAVLESLGFDVARDEPVKTVPTREDIDRIIASNPDAMVWLEVEEDT